MTNQTHFRRTGEFNLDGPLAGDVTATICHGYNEAFGMTNREQEKRMSGSNRGRRCDGVVRRDLLHVGGLTALGIGLSDWFALRDAAATEGDAGTDLGAADQGRSRASLEPRAPSCILIWLDGGPSHLETFDLKPEAPSEVRGPLYPTATNVPGIAICEHLSRTAAVMDRVALIRSMTSPLGEHNFASHYLLTGYQPTPSLSYPGLPSVVTHVRDDRGTLPANIAVTRPNAMIGPGYLPASAAAFVIDSDPARPDFKVRDLDLRLPMTAARLSRRRTFRDAVDRLAMRTEEAAAQTSGGDPAFDQAFRLIQSPAARAAFDLQQERDQVRNEYGRHTIGQGCLLARRLIEAGTRFVTVTDRGWDTHTNLYTQLKEGYTGGTAGKIPKLDQAYSSLIRDLDDRGLLDSTLVVLMGEFGRTPKLNPQGGRDHWPRAFSIALAGGGIRGGQVVGRSDSRGERPADRPVTPADLMRTIYQLIGVDPDLELRTADGRPVQINRDGRLVEELLP